MLTRRDLLEGFGAAGLTLFVPARSLAQTPAGPPTFSGEMAGETREVDGVRFSWCPAGRFTMGSPPGETGRRADEAQVEVTISRGFWLAACETTQGEWRRIHGAPTERPLSETFGLGDDVPVYWVSYGAAEAYCAAFTARARKAGVLPAGWICRLPTEAQWEYACRAGTTAATAFGDRLDRADANFNGAPLNGGSDGPSAGRASCSAPMRRQARGSSRSKKSSSTSMRISPASWCRNSPSAAPR